MTIEDLIELAEHLSPSDKVRLIERLLPAVQGVAPSALSHSNGRRRSLRGILRDAKITPQDIAEARKEMWRDFPREID